MFLCLAVALRNKWFTGLTASCNRYYRPRTAYDVEIFREATVSFFKSKAVTRKSPSQKHLHSDKFSIPLSMHVSLSVSTAKATPEEPCRLNRW
jgi:hypothetical protein